MKREEFLKSVGGGMAALLLLDGCATDNEESTQQTAKVPGTLTPFTGEFSPEMASHLLRRATFGADLSQVRKCAELGLDKTIDLLFKDQPLPSPPLNYEFTKDPFVEIGETWIEAPYLRNDFVIQPYRRKSIRAWILNLIYNEGISIREQLTLFWMNHFGVTGLFEHKFEYIHNQLMRSFAWGNFKGLVKRVTIDPAMLVFLNGRDNTRKAPNENFARELLELFTVGKGPMAGEGDYTTFTEHDVRQAAIVLTGWEDVGHFSFNKHIPIGADYTLNRHANKRITLSSRFNEARIPATGAHQYIDLIDTIFQSPDAALHICRKLYIWFVNAGIDEAVENEIIVPMAAHLRANNYEVKPVLVALLKSEHFFDQFRKSQKIKNPVEFVVGSLKQFQVSTPEDMFDRYTFWYDLFEVTFDMGMGYFIPPGVAGWKPYYQKPAYYKLWINAATMQIRNNYISDIFKKYIREYSAVGMDITGLVANVVDGRALEPFDFVNELCGLYLARPLTEEQTKPLVDALTSGTGAGQWAILCGQYINGQLSSDDMADFESGFNLFLKQVFNMTEFQLV